MNYFEIIGYVASGLNIWGNVAIAQKSTKGWLVRLVCNVTWIVYSSIFGIYPLLINHIIFAGINIYGWRKWKEEERHENLRRFN